MNLKKINNIIPFLSVGTMVVWGVLANDWSKSWLAVFIGGILMGILNVVGRKDNSFSNEDNENKNKED